MEEKYPGDAVIFESSARLDIPKIQQALSDDQVLLHYMQLHWSIGYCVYKQV